MFSVIFSTQEWEQKNLKEKAAYEIAMEKYRQELKDNPPSSAEEGEE
jgi:hypothetical protein